MRTCLCNNVDNGSSGEERRGIQDGGRVARARQRHRPAAVRRLTGHIRLRHAVDGRQKRADAARPRHSVLPPFRPLIGRYGQRRI